MISEATFLISLLMDGIAILLMMYSLSMYGWSKPNRILLPIVLILIAFSITVGVLFS